MLYYIFKDAPDYAKRAAETQPGRRVNKEELFMISKLPERILAECSRIVLESGDIVFDEAAAELRNIPGAPAELAQKPGQNNRRSLMERARLYLKSCPAVFDDEKVQEVLRGNSLYQRFTIVLSEEAIANAYKAFACGLGEPALMLALCLDPRQAVREIAEKHLAENPAANPWSGADGRPAMAEFLDHFTSFLLSIKDFLPEEEPASPGPAPADRQGGGSDKAERELREKVEDLKKKKENAEAEARRNAEDLSKTKKEFAAVQKRIDELAEGLARQKLEEILLPVFKTETVLSGLHPGDLQSVPAMLALAESGRCRAMAERIDKFISAAVILRDGLADPPEVLKKIFTELGELKSRVASAEKLAADIGALKLSYAGLRTLSQQEDLPDLIGAAVNSGRLSKKERDGINKVVELMCERTSGRVSLGHLIRAGEPFLLIVDGHNLMHFAYEKRAFAEKEKNSATLQEFLPAVIHEKMKNRLIPDAFALLAAKSRACRIKLYFDTTGNRQELPLGNLTVIHSGGWGSQRADYSMICDAAEEFADFGIPKFISTNDKKLVETLKQTLPEASVISPDDLNRLLAANSCGDLTKR